MYHTFACRRLVALAIFVCFSIAIGARRTRPKEQLPIDEPIGTATIDPQDKEVQHLINELFPSLPHYEDLQPVFDELLEGNPHYEEQPLADKTTRDTLYEHASLEETLALEREKRNVAPPEQQESSFDSPATPAATSPRKKRRAWSADEDEQLNLLVAELGSKNWAEVASRLQDRDTTQCWRRWHSFLSPQLNKSEWKPEEDQDIGKGVTEIGRKWAQIRRQYMPNRNETAIRNRWRSIDANKSSPHIAKPNKSSPHRWSAVEDEQLKHLVAEHDSEDWAAIAAGMQDRDRKQCSERWRYYLRPQLNKSEWTPEEDQDIRKGVSRASQGRYLRPQLDKSEWTPEEDQDIRKGVTETGGMWAQISEQYMPNRSVTDIRNRWSSIIRKSRARATSV